MLYITGYDVNGAPRVSGQHQRDLKRAEKAAKAAAIRYIAERPETGPISDWTFRHDMMDRRLAGMRDE
jgi:hypothetical protein